MTEEIIVNDDNFDEILKSNSTKLVVVDFYADWCMPCKMLGPILEKVSKKQAGKVVVLKINVDTNPKKSREYKVSGIPAVKFFKKGKMVDEFIGFRDQKEVESIIERNLN